MASFLKDISGFYGTGERNAAGQTLEEFLEAYDPYRYKTPSCTTDAVIFAYEGERCESVEGLKLLLVKRSNHPSIGYWALPGGFIDLNEDLDDTARRELEEETGVKGLLMEQVAAYGDQDRDPRARVITTAYMSLVREDEVKVQAGDDAADAVWCDVSLVEMPAESAGKNAEPVEEAETERRRENGGADAGGMAVDGADAGGAAADSSGADKPEADKSAGYREYCLTVSNGDRGLSTSACVAHTVRGDLIREEKFSVLRRGQIAADHAAIIVQAFLKLKERVERSE